MRLTRATGGYVHGEIIDARLAEKTARFEIVLAFSCVRPGPVEEILRHATELGVSRLVPLISSRTTRRPKERKDRWISIVRAAAAQSGRNELPGVEDLTTLSEFIESVSDPATRLILSTDSRARPLLSLLEEMAPQKVVIVVGPEGGFDCSEQAEAIAEGFLPASLGHGTLRTETAALCAASMAVMWNDWFKYRLLVHSRGAADSIPIRSFSVDSST